MMAWTEERKNACWRPPTYKAREAQAGGYRDQITHTEGGRRRADRRDQAGAALNGKFDRSFDSLQQIFEFADRFYALERIDQRHHFAVNFAIEELFTNMVKYNAGNPHQVMIEMQQTDGQLIAHLTDFDVDPFDVTAEREVDTESPLEDRKIGGLGLHLIPKMIDTIDYDYDESDRRSRITFTKALR